MLSFSLRTASSFGMWRGFPKVGSQLIITHGSLGASYHSVSAFFKSHSESARSWSEKLGHRLFQGRNYFRADAKLFGRK